jgi:hypothetical protein
MYQINKKKMFVDIADDLAIIINSETGIYYGINNFGTTVFENIMQGADVDAILAELKKIPNIPADIAQRLTDFIADLESKEIIIADKAKAFPVQIKADLAVADNFVLEVQEYADAQELLLADPIHDVDEELGWQPSKE